MHGTDIKSYFQQLASHFTIQTELTIIPCQTVLLTMHQGKLGVRLSEGHVEYICFFCDLQVNHVGIWVDSDKAHKRVVFLSIQMGHWHLLVG